MRPLCSVMKTRLRGPRHSRRHWSVCPGHAPTEGASVSVPRAPSRPAVPYRLRRRPANHLLARLPAVPWLIPASGPDTLPRPAHLPAPSEYPPPGSPPGPLCTWPRCRDSLAQDRGAPFPPRRSQAASAQSTTTAPLTPSPAHPLASVIRPHLLGAKSGQTLESTVCCVQGHQSTTKSPQGRRSLTHPTVRKQCTERARSLPRSHSA